jgi:phthalate 4,5-dioxygenase reductase subunit
MSVNPSAPMGALSAAEPDFFPLKVARKEEVAQGIYLFELRHPTAHPCPPSRPART